jgi:hypothetical protein
LVSYIEYSIIVGHESVTQDPEVELVRGNNVAKAVVFIDLTIVQAEGEVQATTEEGNGRGKVARVRVESVALVGGRLSTRDLLIERSNVFGRANDKGSSL